jgi:hypothetical protein
MDGESLEGNETTHDKYDKLKAKNSKKAIIPTYIHTNNQFTSLFLDFSNDLQGSKLNRQLTDDAESGKRANAHGPP